MARVSLLFSLAFAFVVASAFAYKGPSSSVPLKSAKYSPPCTVGQLKTLPFIEIAKLVDLKSRSKFKTPELTTAFAVFKDYTSFLARFSKRADFGIPFYGPASLIWKAKFASMSKALLAAQMGFEFGGKGSLELKKNYDGMIHGFAVIPAKIAEISARHQFRAGAKLSVQEQKEFVVLFGAFKKSMNCYIDALEIAAKKHVSAGGGVGGKVEFSASGSGKVDVHGKKKKKAHHQRRSLLLAGEDGFRSLNRPYIKHLVGFKA